MRLNVLAAVCAIAALIGCDVWYYGALRYTDEMPGLPNPDCVTDAMMSVDGVSNVKHQYVPDTQKVATFHGNEFPDQRHTFSYEYDGIANTLSYATRYDFKTRYRHDFACMNCALTKEFVARVEHLHPIMKEIDRAIDSRCKLPGLMQSIRESCNTVNCTDPAEKVDLR